MSASRSSDETSSRESEALIVDYHPGASSELIEAAGFYENRSVGLGHVFLDAVESAVAILQDNPELGCLDARGRRRWLIRRFPHLIIYRIEGSFLHILAVAHTGRRPEYWDFRDV